MWQNKKEIMNIIRLMLLPMIVILLFFGVRNLTALITYVHPYTAIASLVVAGFLIIAVIKTWKD
jgi:hypothetical protein